MERLCVQAESSQTSKKAAEQLSQIITRQGTPESIASNHGSEFVGQYANLVLLEWRKLDFKIGGKPAM
jgi:hypothetical protein